jgi:O-antigen ligase/peptidoglycan/xylan/chitin deacetylase (PgdA/CDA1 family)
VTISARRSYAGSLDEAKGVPQPRSLDRVGIVLVVSTIAWTSFSALRQGGRPLPLIGTLLGVIAAYELGRAGARRSPSLAPATMLCVAALVLVSSPVANLIGGPGEGSFGYANARAAFFLVGATAGLMLFPRVTGRLRWVLVGVTVALLMVAPLAGARTATIAAGGVALTALVGARRTIRRGLLTVWAAAAALVLVGTLWVAAGQSSARVVRALDERRVSLWTEALDLMVAHPVTGVGPGRFAEFSTITPEDADAQWAHHDFLQQGAETGVVGLALLGALFAWAYSRLWNAAAPVDQVVLAGGVLGALAIMASTDYVLHFPLIPVSVAGLVGAASDRAAPPTAGRRPSSTTRRAVKLAVLPWGLVTRRKPGDLVMLLYHRIGAGEREIDVPLEQFEEQMAVLAARGDARSLDEGLSGGGVVVTFDDGQIDFHRHALPVLVEHRIPSLLYLATGLVDSGPEGLTWGQLREAVGTGLVTVGGHTHAHTDLSRSTEAEADRELAMCKAMVEDNLGVPCRHFAYPWAVGSAAAERSVRRHFETAALHAWRINRGSNIERYRLGRTPVLRSDGSFFFGAKLRGMLDGESLAYRALARGPWGRG